MIFQRRRNSSLNKPHANPVTVEFINRGVQIAPWFRGRQQGGLRPCADTRKASLWLTNRTEASSPMRFNVEPKPREKTDLTAGIERRLSTDALTSLHDKRKLVDLLWVKLKVAAQQSSINKLGTTERHYKDRIFVYTYIYMLCLYIRGVKLDRSRQFSCPIRGRIAASVNWVGHFSLCEVSQEPDYTKRVYFAVKNEPRSYNSRLSMWTSSMRRIHANSLEEVHLH